MKKFFIGGFLLTAFYLIQPQALFAQLPQNVASQIQKITPKPAQNSPNAASIQKYGDFQVNLFTGIPDISIPLFDLESGPLKVPIVLSYHAGGIRYTDKASWVGLGWSIQAGGQITRTVAGKPDEAGYLGLINDYTVDPFNYCGNFSYKELTANGTNDREPDQFSYNFPGGSGRFLLRQGNQAPLQFPYKAYSITRSGMNFFDITDTKGIAYRFGANWSGGDGARETSISSTGSTGPITWYLKEIKSPTTDDFVSFSYQTVGTISSTEIESNITLMDQCNSMNQTILPCNTYLPVLTQVSTFNSITQLGIHEIFFKTGKVKFILGSDRTDLPDSPGVRRLSKIEVYSKVNQDYVLFRSFTFLNSSNFKLATTRTDARLKLDGLEIRDGAGALINTYNFSYSTTTFSWDQHVNSFRRDFFGFYNGKTANTNLIPQQTVPYQSTTSNPTISNLVIGGADKSTDTTFYREGMLKRITFPTGGFTEFEFEPHKYRDGAAIMYGSGLRIKKITKNDGVNSYFTLYRYGNNDDGFGIKNFDVRSFHYLTTQYQRSTDPNIRPFPQRQYRVRSWVSNSVVGPGFDDSPVIYTRVTEYENGSTANGKTVYEFDNGNVLADGVFTVQYSNKTWRNSKSWERGKITRIQKFDSNNNPVEEIVKTYTKLNGQAVNVGQAAAEVIIGEESGGYFLTCTSQNGAATYDGHRYMIATITQDTGIWLETSSTATLYSGGTAVQTVTNKGYHSTYLQPAFEEVIASSNPAELRTTYRYPYDIVSPTVAYTGLPNILKQMLLKNMLYPVEEYTWVKQTTSSTQQIVAGKVTQYDQISGTTFYQPKFAYFLETSTLGSSYAVMGLSGTSALTVDSRQKLRLTFNQYDTRGNLLEYSPSDGQPVSFVYGYDGSYATAQFINASSDQVAYTSFESHENGGWTYSGSPLRMNPSEARSGHSAYSLSSGAISRTVSGASSTNRFKLSFWAKAASGTQSWTFLGVTESLDTNWKLIEREVTTASLSISGSNILVDELRISPVTSLVTTTAYTPLIGKTSEFDPRGQGIHYFYDPFGRLLSVKNDEGHLLKHYEYTTKK